MYLYGRILHRTIRTPDTRQWVNNEIFRIDLAAHIDFSLWWMCLLKLEHLPGRSFGTRSTSIVQGNQHVSCMQFNFSETKFHRMPKRIIRTQFLLPFGSGVINVSSCIYLFIRTDGYRWFIGFLCVLVHPQAEIRTRLWLINNETIMTTSHM